MKSKNLSSRLGTIVAALAIVLFMAHGSARAAGREDLVSIAESKELKNALIMNLQDEIRSQEDMTKEEIIQNYKEKSAKAREELLRVGGPDLARFDLQEKNALGLLSSLDKEEIIALEKAELQSLMTADNSLFTLTRSTVGCIHDAGHSHSGAAAAGVFFCSMLLPFMIAIDGAILPFELLYTVLTGF